MSLLKNLLASIITIDDVVAENADVDGDSLLNMRDYTTLKLILAST